MGHCSTSSHALAKVLRGSPSLNLLSCTQLSGWYPQVLLSVPKCRLVMTPPHSRLSSPQRSRITSSRVNIQYDSTITLASRVFLILLIAGWCILHRIRPPAMVTSVRIDGASKARLQSPGLHCLPDHPRAGLKAWIARSTLLAVLKLPLNCRFSLTLLRFSLPKNEHGRSRTRSTTTTTQSFAFGLWAVSITSRDSTTRNNRPNSCLVEAKLKHGVGEHVRHRNSSHYAKRL